MKSEAQDIDVVSPVRDFIVNDGEEMHTWQPENQAEKILQKEVSLDDYEDIRVTKEKDIPQHEPIIRMGGAPVASSGNVTAISAAAKAGKTSFIGVILAGAISTTGKYDGFTELEVMPNPEMRAVIHFDSEQAESDQQYLVNTVLRRASLKVTPDNFLSYNIRKLSLGDYQSVTAEVCRLAASKCGGVHLIVIDGGADYIPSVNDEASANRIIEFFTHLGIEHECPVIVIVHLNPAVNGAEAKERGHFGSQIQRKCYGLLTIKKKDDVSIVEAKIMRKAGVKEVPAIFFKYNKDKGYHTETDKTDGADAKAAKGMDQAKLLASKILPPPTALKNKDLVPAIMQATGKKERMAQSTIKDLVGWRIVDKGDDGYYRLNV
jgi:hypothetical protein